MSIQVTVSKRQGLTGATASVVRLAGILDAVSAKDAKRELDPVVATGPRAVILDLADLKFVDSTGIGVLISTRKALEAIGSKVFLTNLQPQIRKVMDIVQAMPKDTIFGSVDELDAYLSEMQKRTEDV